MKVQYSKLLLFSISLFLVFEGLDAYSLNNIPIYWIGVSFLLLVFIGLHFLGFKASSFNFVSVRNWVFYGISITLIQSIFNDIVLPKYASTTYVQYISLRLLRLLFFLVVIYCIDYILKKYSFEIEFKQINTTYKYNTDTFQNLNLNNLNYSDVLFEKKS